jgi:hypothetical protein
MSDGPPNGFFPVVYDELKRLAAARLAHERAGRSLDATALVHEAYLRLGDAVFADRSGFFRAAAVAMQRILVDDARSRKVEMSAYARLSRTPGDDGSLPRVGGRVPGISPTPHGRPAPSATPGRPCRTFGA